MNRDQQKKFIAKLYMDALEDIHAKIDKGSIPVTWTDKELRTYSHEYIAKTYDDINELSEDKNRHRFRQYRKDIKKYNL